METKHIQTAIRINRLILSTLYEDKKLLKKHKRFYDFAEDTAREYACHNALNKITKDIAKLVDLQKALKAELKDYFYVERFINGGDL
jgi:hypothetical protein